MSSRLITENAITTLLKWLSESNGIKVTCSITHVVDRMIERGIDLKEVLTAMKDVVNGQDFCIHLFEAAVAGGFSNFYIYSRDGVKIYYSIRLLSAGISVVFRTVV